MSKHRKVHVARDERLKSKQNPLIKTRASVFGTADQGSTENNDDEDMLAHVFVVSTDLQEQLLVVGQEDTDTESVRNCGVF